MQPRPVNQQLAEEIRQLQSGDLVVDSTGEVCAVIRQVSHDSMEFRNVRDTRSEVDVNSLARNPDRTRMVRQGSTEYAICAATYINKERCQSN